VVAFRKWKSVAAKSNTDFRSAISASQKGKSYCGGKCTASSCPTRPYYKFFWLSLLLHSPEHDPACIYDGTAVL